MCHVVIILFTEKKSLGGKRPLDISYTKRRTVRVTEGKISMNTMYNLFFHQFYPICKTGSVVVECPLNFNEQAYLHWIWPCLCNTQIFCKM